MGVDISKSSSWVRRHSPPPGCDGTPSAFPSSWVRRDSVDIPLLLGGGVRGGGDKYGHNIFHNRIWPFLIHPTPDPSPKGVGVVQEGRSSPKGAGNSVGRALSKSSSRVRRHSPPSGCDGTPSTFPSSWEEGLGVEEINTVTTYFIIGYDRFWFTPPLTPPLKGRGVVQEGRSPWGGAYGILTPTQYLVEPKR